MTCGLFMKCHHWRENSSCSRQILRREHFIERNPQILKHSISLSLRDSMRQEYTGLSSPTVFPFVMGHVTCLLLLQDIKQKKKHANLLCQRQQNHHPLYQQDI